ncbi:MAG: UDP-2,3-diacylglucosamine diphosphatase LpxI [Nitrospinae bacterium]|nr:UDP-2,3-diacylglucosamine diphosphatase LpxI [Nitrospinota bacterium]
MENGIKRLGLIAGSGSLPAILASEASSSGAQVISIAFTEESAKLLKPFSASVYHYGVGEAGKILKCLKNEGVRDVALVGKVEKRFLFQNFKFDLRAIKILSRLRNRNDDTIMHAIVNELEREGINVVDQMLFLKRLFPSKGALTKNISNDRENKDIEYGLKIAKDIAGLDIGQTVVVKDRAVLAVEAIEGTDEAIQRGCGLCNGGAVVVKVAKPKQDPRFDVPTIGVKTIETMIKGKASALAIEADKTMVAGRDEVIKTAEENGVSITAV